MSAKFLEPMSEPECTVWCKSREHSFQLVTAVSARPSTDRLQAYCRSLCHNFPLISDEYGRNVLHMGASCGDLHFVRWLIEKCHSEVDLKDTESGWTALHRSIFYGQIGCAQTLIELGANLNVVDRNFCTPLDLLMLDRPPYIEYNRSDPCDCYVWGSNVNFNLGVETEQSRKIPEIVNTFKRDGIYIKEVMIRKFHSSFLTNDGKVLTCGHGHGGRLAHDSEDLTITPKLINGLGDSSYVESMASGQDHLILLVRHLKDKSVDIYSCGKNTYHVLGHSPPPEKLLTPKLLCLKSLKLGLHQKMGDILGVGAAKYHSLFYTKEELFTFGLNVGQIGHLKGERTQLMPHRVSALNFRDTGTQLEHVVTSDGAIVCSTNKGDVFVLHEYQCRKVASLQLDIQQICVVGGHLDERTDVAGIHDNSRVELQIMLLTKSRNIYQWKGSDPTLVRCLIGFGRKLSVTHICLNVRAVGIVTRNGDVFFGSVSNRKSKKDIELRRTSIDGTNEMTHKTNQKSIPTKGGAQQVKSFVKFINKDECHTIHVKKQYYIQRAVAVFCDDQNRNFAVLQSSPKIGMLETASKPDSQMIADMKTLYETSDSNDNIHDVVIKVGNRQYFAHKFILSNRSEYFRKKLSLDPECDSINFEQTLINSIEAFEQILKFIYFNSNDLFENSKKLNWNCLKTVPNNSENKNKNNKKEDKNKKSKDKTKTDPLKDLKEMSRKLGVIWLYKWLSSNGVEIVGNKVKVIDRCLPPKLVFDRNTHEFYDLIIKSEDKVEFKCHKCLLMSRLEYFRGMLSSGWIEASTNNALTLPLSAKVLEIIMDYVYKDQSSKLESIEDPEFICQVLVIADQYLIPLLKTYCEYVLVNLLTLRNACEFLELSYIYNAEQLKRCSLDFICINLQTLFETKSLSVLSENAIKDLTECYQNLITRPHKRRVPRHSSAPNSEEFERIFSLFDSNDDFTVNIDEKKAILKQKTRTKRSNRHRNESTSSDILESEDLQLSKLSLSSPKEDSELKKRLNSEEKQNKSNVLSIDIKDEKTLQTNNELSVKPKPLKWGMNSSTIPPPISFKDIITAEEKQFTKISKPKPIVSPNYNQKPPQFVRQNPISIPRRTVANSSPKLEGIESNSPKSFAEMAVSPPKVHSNPWKKFESCSPTTTHINQSILSSYPQIETISMKDIVRAEEEELQNLRASQTKPLHIISIEDKAIEELLDYYKANCNPNEYITVERVISRVAEPVWNRNQ